VQHFQKVSAAAAGAHALSTLLAAPPPARSTHDRTRTTCVFVSLQNTHTYARPSQRTAPARTKTWASQPRDKFSARGRRELLFIAAGSPFGEHRKSPIFLGRRLLQNAAPAGKAPLLTFPLPLALAPPQRTSVSYTPGSPRRLLLACQPCPHRSRRAMRPLAA